MSKKHYSPKAQVVVSQTAQEGDGFFALYSIPTPTGAIRLGSPIDIEEFAHTLYSVLRKGDSIGLKRIVIEPPVGTGLSIAIRDRLRKAAGMP
jgi:O-acetyl-ADP-ribose deacetylase (regulator of RNase III)